MTERSRIERRDDLLIGLGMLVRPIKEMVDSGDASNSVYVRGRFNQERRRFGAKLRTAMSFPELDLSTDTHNILEAIRSLDRKVIRAVEEGRLDDARHSYNVIIREAQGAIKRLPTDDISTIFPAESPYTSWVRLRAVCRSATERLHLFDPWVDDSVFYRYLCDMPQGIDLVVVTHRKTMGPGLRPENEPRRDRVVAVSTLLAAERPDSYRLLVTDQQHDRHLRVDDQILHLGGSLKDAGRSAPYTISPLDPSVSNHESLDALIASATEWYGLTKAEHRRE